MSVRGWVYVLTNKAMPGLVKIGYSTKDPSLRASELEGTGLPHPFTVEYDVILIEPRDVEQATHMHLKDFHEGKEFFRIDVLGAISAIRSVIAQQKKTVISETILEGEIDDSVDDEVDAPHAWFWRLRLPHLKLTSPQGSVTRIADSDVIIGSGIRVGHGVVPFIKIELTGHPDLRKTFVSRWRFPSNT